MKQDIIILREQSKGYYILTEQLSVSSLSLSLYFHSRMSAVRSLMTL